MRITDLLDSYEDSSVLIPEADTPTVARTRELVLQKLNAAPAKRRRSRPLLLLAAAVVVLALTATAGAAYYITHQNTVSLMESGPSTGGQVPVKLNDANKAVIEDASKDYGLAAQDQGATVTLDSAMGYYSDHMSVLYLTLTLTPPEGTEFTADMEECGFWQLEQRLSGENVGYDGSCTALENENGTIGVMLMYHYRGNVNGRSLTLTLDGFGNVSKEVAHELYSGTRTIEIPGTWEFTIDTLDLEQAQELAFDPSAFHETGFVPERITVSSFGGMLTTSGDSAGIRLQNAAEDIRAAHPELEWDGMTTEQLNLLMAAGGIFTAEETEQLSAILAGDSTFGAFDSIQVRYPDGTCYEGRTDIWMGADENGNILHAFQFDAPQDLTEAKALFINGVEVPLS